MAPGSDHITFTDKIILKAADLAISAIKRHLKAPQPSETPRRRKEEKKGKCFTKAYFKNLVPKPIRRFRRRSSPEPPVDPTAARVKKDSMQGVDSSLEETCVEELLEVALQASLKAAIERTRPDPPVLYDEDTVLSYYPSWIPTPREWSPSRRGNALGPTCVQIAPGEIRIIPQAGGISLPKNYLAAFMDGPPPYERESVLKMVSRE
jgi:hypothetical protein